MNSVRKCAYFFSPQQHAIRSPIHNRTNGISPCLHRHHCYLSSYEHPPHAHQMSISGMYPTQGFGIFRTKEGEIQENEKKKWSDLPSAIPSILISSFNTKYKDLIYWYRIQSFVSHVHVTYNRNHKPSVQSIRGITNSTSHIGRILQVITCTVLKENAPTISFSFFLSGEIARGDKKK